jgi:hypothetical protein
MHKNIVLIFMLLTGMLTGANAQSCRKSKLKYDCTMVIVSCLHFDSLAATNRFPLAKAIDKVETHFSFPSSATPAIAGEIVKKLSGVIPLGEMSNKPHTKILHAYSPTSSYSWNVGGVHFVNGAACATDVAHSDNYFEWLEEDLKRYASKDVPVVYIQYDDFGQELSDNHPDSSRNRLFDILEQYHLAAAFIGHGKSASLEQFRGHIIYQVNEAYQGNERFASFAVLRIKENAVSVVTCKVLDGNGCFAAVKPMINVLLPDK